MLLLIDACILIDFQKTDISVLAKVVQHLAPVFVISPIIEEVEGLDDSDLLELGFSIIEPELDDALAAAERKVGGPLSFEKIKGLITV